jgi:hypothetical protein
VLVVIGFETEDTENGKVQALTMPEGFAGSGISTRIGWTIWRTQASSREKALWREMEELGGIGGRDDWQQLQKEQSQNGDGLGTNFGSYDVRYDRDVP